MKRRVFIQTFGCQMNAHDSEKMLGILSDCGYTSADCAEDADLVVLNTCAIREKAEQKFFSQLGRLKHLKRRGGVKIAVAGCIAQEAGKRIFSRAPFVDYVVGPRNIHHMARMLGDDQGTYTDGHPSIGTLDFRPSRRDCFRAWVTIMYGCNNFCSYCIVPYTRGREESRPSSSILHEIRELKEKGYREVTLLGQNVNSYRSDIGFVDLLKEIDRIGMDRVRFVTSHPRDFDVPLIDAIASLPSLCEHIHLPLQSGSDRVLRAMNRGYTYAEYREKVARLRDRIPNMAITTDVIVGFPGENDADFTSTLTAVEETAFDGIFAFKFSTRQGTKAAGMDAQVDEGVKAGRLDALLRLQDSITLRKNREIEGRAVEILLEGLSETDPQCATGRTRTNKIVTIGKTDHHKEGDLISVRISRARHHSLHGSCICHPEALA